MIDLDGPDRVSGSESYYEKTGSDWWRVAISTVYPEESGSAPVTNSIQRTRLTGLTTNLTAETVSIDIFGNATTNRTAVNRSTKTQTRTTTYPDSTNTAVQVTVNGLLMSSETKTGLEYTYAYDGLQRRTGVTDPRTGTSLTHYNDNGQVDYTEDAATNRTRYVYDSATGRRSAVSNALDLVTRYAV